MLVTKKHPKHYFALRVIESGLSTRLLNHYYTRCTKLETKNL